MLDANVCCREGIDHLLAQHIAHLFIRDPVSVFNEKIHLDDSHDTDHFEVMDYNHIALLKIVVFDTAVLGNEFYQLTLNLLPHCLVY